MHALAALLSVGLLASGPVPPTAGLGGSAGPADAVARAEAMHVLGDWDAARSRAYVESDRIALAELYADGAGRADLAILDDYARRGLRVWQRAQVFSATLLHGESQRFRLRIVDRTLTVVGDGRQCRSLPVSAVGVREVTFVHDEGRWRVAGVRAARPAARR